METRSREEIEESTERLLQDLKAVVQDGEELLRAGVQELGERGNAAREKLIQRRDQQRNKKRGGVLAMLQIRPS